MYKNHSIAVIIPCLNEALSIAEVINYIPNFVDEIIVVDNASQDNTAEITTETNNFRYRFFMIKSKPTATNAKTPKGRTIDAYASKTDGIISEDLLSLL
jgi:glycosyltransferase involved in cell wall biosynthesis